MKSLQQMINEQIGNLKKELIAVDGFDEPIVLLELTGKLLEQWESYCVEFDAVRKRSASAAKQTFALRAVLIGMSLCESDGSRPFNDKNGYEKLSSLPSNIIDRLFDDCQRLNHLGRYFQDTMGNSDAGQSEDS